MRATHPRRILLAGGIVLMLSAPPASRGLAADNELALQAVRQLLDQGWHAKTSQARQEGERLYQQWEPLQDWRIDYARVLVLVRQYQYADANRSLRSLLESHSDWQLKRAKTWLSLACRQYDEALLELVQLSGELPPAVGDDHLGREAALEMGRMAGFLEGPAEMNRAAWNRAMVRLNAKLTPVRADALAAGRRQVAQEYAQFSAERLNLRTQAVEKVKRQRDEQLADIAKQRDQSRRRRAELNDSAARLRNELTVELANLDKSDADLRDEIAKLDQQAAVVDSELSLLGGDIARLGAQWEREPDPVTRSRIQREIRRLEKLAARYDADLLALEGQLQTAARQRREVAQLRSQVRIDTDQQLAQLDRDLDDVQQLDRRLRVQELRAQRWRPPSTGGARSVAARAGIIATYVPFPLVPERARLVGLLTSP